MTFMTDMIAADGVDLDRLERGLELVGERVGVGRYRVAGGAQVHWVDLYTTSIPRCDCGDHLWRERICKHILAALLREGDERVVASLAVLMRRVRDRASSAPAVTLPPRSVEDHRAGRRASRRPSAANRSGAPGGR